MHRAVLISCLPYLAGIVLSVAVLWALLRLSRARLKLAAFAGLHRDERGGVQSLSFVLTLPLFIMLMMFIVQLSQLTIAKVVVEYSAYAAARAAMVWIPAEAPREWANQIGQYRTYVRDVVDESTGREYTVYEVDTSGRKADKIRFAAAMACMPICPSRDVQAPGSEFHAEALAAIREAYRLLDPRSEQNTRIPARLDNKLAYAWENTRVVIEVYHAKEVAMGADAPLDRYPLLDRWQYRPEFAENEYGWQDQLFVTVVHDFALLPGPGRLLARRADASPGTSAEEAPGYDEVAENIDREDGVYKRALTATVRMSNEGQKSVLPYIQPLLSDASFNEPPLDEHGRSPGEDDYADDREGDEFSPDGEDCCGEDRDREDEPDGELGDRDDDGEREREGNDREGGERERDDGEDGERGAEGREPEEQERPEREGELDRPVQRDSGVNGNEAGPTPNPEGSQR